MQVSCFQVVFLFVKLPLEFGKCMSRWHFGFYSFQSISLIKEAKLKNRSRCGVKSWGLGTEVTYDTRATCTSQSAPAPPHTRQDPTSASSAAFGPHGRTSRCTHSSPTRVTACTGWCLPTHHGKKGQRSAAQTPGRINQPASLSLWLLNTLPARGDSRHSGIMHFSTSATSALHMEPSMGGIFTMRSRRLIPRPQVTLQGSHSAHSVTTQLLGAGTSGREDGISRGGIHTAREENATKGKRKCVVIILLWVVSIVHF